MRRTRPIPLTHETKRAVRIEVAILIRTDDNPDRKGQSGRSDPSLNERSSDRGRGQELGQEPRRAPRERLEGLRRIVEGRARDPEGH